VTVAQGLSLTWDWHEAHRALSSADQRASQANDPNAAAQVDARQFRVSAQHTWRASDSVASTM